MSRQRSDRGPLLEALHRASRQLTNQNGLYTDAAAARLGMNRTDLDCLSIVGLAGMVTAGELADITGLTTGAVTGVIDRLVAAGYVVREADPADRRRVIVRGVPEIGRVTGELFEPMHQALAQLYGRYSDEELAVLLDLNERLLPIMQEQTARLRERPQPADAPTTVHSAPLGNLAGARLEFTRGIANASVRTGSAGPELYRAHVERNGPTITALEGTVTVTTKKPGFRWGRAGRCEIELNPTVPWTVSLRGGGSRFDADLQGVVLRDLELTGGLSNAELVLPAPQGTVALRFTGGVNNLTVRRPEGVPLRVRVRGGVSNLRLDDQRFVAVRGTMSWETPGYAATDDRYDISLTGGASTLTIQ